MTFDWQANFFKMGAILPMSDRGVIDAGDYDIARELIEAGIVEKHGAVQALNIIYLAPREDS